MPQGKSLVLPSKHGERKTEKSQREENGKSKILGRPGSCVI